MKRTLIFFSPWIFALFIGCGGDDSPPPKTANADAESLKNLECISKLAQQICCNEQTAAAATYEQWCATAVQPSPVGGSYTLPTPPQPKTPVAQTPAQIPGCQPSTQPLTCQQAISNFELQYSTTYAKDKNSETEKWKENQGKAVITCVGNNMGISTPEEFYSNPTAQCQAAQTYQNFASQAPATITGAVPAGVVPQTPSAASANTASTIETITASAGTTASGAPAPITTELPTGNGFTGSTSVPRGMTASQVQSLTANSIPKEYWSEIAW